MKNKFNIGDIVLVNNLQFVLPLHMDSIVHFNLINFMLKTHKVDLGFPLIDNHDVRIKWIVVGIGIFKYASSPIYCLMSPNLHRYIIVIENGLVLNQHFNQNQTNYFRERYKDYKIKEIKFLHAYQYAKINTLLAENFNKHYYE